MPGRSFKLIFVHGSVHKYDPDMADSRATKRSEGTIRRRGGSYQVRVYAGVDPVTNKANYLTESTSDEKEAKRILRRLLAEVDEQRNARRRATLGTAIDAWLKIHEVEDNTLNGYRANARL
jgi:integrase